MATVYKTLSLESKLEGQVQVLGINRPEALNALNSELLKELGSALEQLEADKNLRVLIITGMGEKAFVAGADIKEMENYDSTQALLMATEGQKVFNRIQDFSRPVIAAVNGFALGGGLELALSCDFIMASEKAKLGLPEVSLGLIPGYGGTQRLSRVVGKAWARRLTLTGEMLTAEKAKEIGLVTEVFPAEGLMLAVTNVATTIASRSPIALRLAKNAINDGFETSLIEGLELEAQNFAKAFSTQDHNEGIRAFLEKRKANFTGN